METQALSATHVAHPTLRFVESTDSSAAHRRGEDIFGVPTMPAGKTWQIDAQVTPADAKQILMAMPVQRPVRQSHVARMAAAMKSGRWLKIHQGIAFDTNGRLIDGQHRLNAIIAADVAVPLRVNFNEPKESFSVLDRHERRVLADDLVTSGSISGRQDSKILAAAIRIVVFYDAGQHPGLARKSSSGKDAVPVTHDEAWAALDRHQHLRAAVAYAMSRKPILPRGITAGLGALFMDANPDKAREFLDAVLIGDGVHVGDPAYALREFLTRGHLLSKNRPAIIVGTVRAWNSYVKKQPLSKIDTVLRTGEFPRVLGFKK